LSHSDVTAQRNSASCETTKMLTIRIGNFDELNQHKPMEISVAVNCSLFSHNVQISCAYVPSLINVNKGPLDKNVKICCNIAKIINKYI
jgi:hypothetical protein